MSDADSEVPWHLVCIYIGIYIYIYTYTTSWCADDADTLFTTHALIHTLYYTRFTARTSGRRRSERSCRHCRRRRVFAPNFPHASSSSRRATGCAAEKLLQPKEPLEPLEPFTVSAGPNCQRKPFSMQARAN